MLRQKEFSSASEQRESGSHHLDLAASFSAPDSLPTHQQLGVTSLTAGFQGSGLSANVASPGGQAVPFSLDPYAGIATYNGLPIYTPQQAADNLNRAGVNFTFGNNGALDDGVLTYGFWNSLDEVQHSYYTETNADGEVLTQDGDYIAQGVFAPFTDEQRAMAVQNIGLWDDLIAVTFRQADSAADADITFGFTQMSPAAGAHTYYPQEEALNDAYGFQTAGRAAGDVWANIAYQGDFSGENALAGNYGWFAITHELGHSLGLSHGGEYNASDDKDGDGKPDPITYTNDAYFAQDTQQYTIMSYFDGRYTGQAAVNWDTGYFAYAQTPAVHDILAVQDVYGADYTTRAGDTVYGFHSTADRDIFDFTQNSTPILTIWDGGGHDTLDLSGFNSNAIIDINEGAFSSAGYKMTQDWLDYFASVGINTQAKLDAFYARNGLGPDGRPVDNIAIAYGAKIEDAIGGSGNDAITGNALNNRLVGNAGNDTIKGGDGIDVISLGAGNDKFVEELGSKVSTKAGALSWDVITDFTHGSDKIDLSHLGTTFHFNGTNANKNVGDLTYKVYDSVSGAEHALGIAIHDLPGANGVSGPVTVVFENLDGGTPDIGLVLLNHNGVSASDFLFA